MQLSIANNHVSGSNLHGRRPRLLERPCSVVAARPSLFRSQSRQQTPHVARVATPDVVSYGTIVVQLQAVPYVPCKVCRSLLTWDGTAVGGAGHSESGAAATAATQAAG
jgi:hypothetical protein